MIPVTHTAPVQPGTGSHFLLAVRHLMATTNTAEHRGAVKGFFFDWSGLIAIGGVIVAFATMQTEVKRLQEDRREDRAAYMALATQVNTNAASVATKSDVGSINLRLDDLYKLILDRDRRP